MTETIKNRVLISAGNQGDNRQLVYRTKFVNDSIHIGVLRLLDEPANYKKVMSGFNACVSILPIDNDDNITANTKIYLVKENILNDILDSYDNFQYGVGSNDNILYTNQDNVILVQDHLWHYSQFEQDDTIIRSMEGSALRIRHDGKRTLEKGDNLYLIFATVFDQAPNNNLYLCYLNYATFLKC